MACLEAVLADDLNDQRQHETFFFTLQMKACQNFGCQPKLSAPDRSLQAQFARSFTHNYIRLKLTL